MKLAGTARVVVPGNLKAAVIRADFWVNGLPELNPSYRVLACHYGFRVDPTPPRSPEKKGKDMWIRLADLRWAQEADR